MGVIGLLLLPGVAAQATTDYDQDDDGLIEVNSLARLNAIRWDLDGDGAADPVYWDHDGDPNTPEQIDESTTEANANSYAAAFPSPADNMGCLFDDDDDPSTDKIVRCIGYELTRNLNFHGSTWASGEGWLPIPHDTDPSTSELDGPPFTATFDGNDNSISNLYINRTAETDLANGLFGFVNVGAEIRNVRLLNVNVTGWENTGGLVGINEGGTISNSQVSGTVAGQATSAGIGGTSVGGLVGNNGGITIRGTITASQASATISGQRNVGGLIGANFGGTIRDSLATGAVSGQGNLGGLVGSQNGGVIADSYASGNVTSIDTGFSGRQDRVGGLIGSNGNSGTIIASYATGNVEGGQTIGGLVGEHSTGGTVSNSWASGAVTAHQYAVGGLVGWNKALISASYATGAVTGASTSQLVGGLVGLNNSGGTIIASYTHGAVEGHEKIGGLVGQTAGTVRASYATGAVTGVDKTDPDTMETITSQLVGGLVGSNSGTITDSYWDTETSGQQVGVGSDDADNSGVIEGTETETPGATGKTTRELKTPTDYADADPDTEDIYADWNLNVDDDLNTGDPTTGGDDPWDFGTASQYPVLQVDFTGDGKIDADDIDPQRRSSGGGSGGGSSGGGSSSKKSSGGGSRAPSPPPVPTRSPIIGSTPAATAMELAGDLLVIQRHDQPGVEVEVGVGWISRDGQRIIAIGFVRDGDLGQTYAVVRREGDSQVVRRWIAPDSPLVYAVPWALVNTQYTFPVGVILAIPLDDQYPWPNMLTRRFDGGDDRILAYDAELGQWRHVPDLATFQARGYYWCNVTAADAGFFDRITLGPPYPASNVPARRGYPVCRT